MTSEEFPRKRRRATDGVVPELLPCEPEAPRRRRGFEPLGRTAKNTEGGRAADKPEPKKESGLAKGEDTEDDEPSPRRAGPPGARGLRGQAPRVVQAGRRASSRTMT